MKSTFIKDFGSINAGTLTYFIINVPFWSNKFDFLITTDQTFVQCDIQGLVEHFSNNEAITLDTQLSSTSFEDTIILTTGSKKLQIKINPNATVAHANFKVRINFYD